MVEELIKDWIHFDELWNNSKHEVFRVQLLDEYKVEGEKELFENYKKGIIKEDPGFKEWLTMIEDLTVKGVKLVNLLLVNLPLNEYVKFGIESYLFSTVEKGQQVMMVERNKVNDIIKEIEDFWMFDRKVAIPLVYDNDGTFLGSRKDVTDEKDIKKLVRIEDSLVKVARPLQEFLNEHNINLVNKTKK